MIDQLRSVSGIPVPRDRSEMRRFVRSHHPDVGGDPALFTKVMSAYERVTAPQDLPAAGIIYVHHRRRGLGVFLDAYLRRREARRRGPRVH